MWMAADSNMNFFGGGGGGGGGVFPPSFYNEHVLSFQSGAANRSPGMIQGGLNGGGLILGGDCSNLGGASPSMIQALGNYGNLMVERLPGLKHDTGLAVEWSFNEQAILNDGLIKFAGEQGMLKYVKIAALLPEKTVRDVALRCRWMAKKENVKRRKIEENYAAKKIQSRKESSTKANMHSVPQDNMAAYPFMLHPANHNNQFSYEVATTDGATQHILDENIQVLNQISVNLSTFKTTANSIEICFQDTDLLSRRFDLKFNTQLQDNIELFSRTSNNITAILNSMSQTPGIMSQMPPLPVSINEDLMNSILPMTSQADRQLLAAKSNWRRPRSSIAGGDYRPEAISDCKGTNVWGTQTYRSEARTEIMAMCSKLRGSSDLASGMPSSPVVQTELLSMIVNLPGLLPAADPAHGLLPHLLLPLPFGLER